MKRATKLRRRALANCAIIQLQRMIDDDPFATIHVLINPKASYPTVRRLTRQDDTLKL